MPSVSQTHFLHFYRRYVDDTYLIFERKEHAEQFFDYINSQHSKITFTKEEEENQKLPFLDMMLERNQNSINTNVYRKKTYTGVGLNFTSYSYSRFKINAFTTFFHRAWRLSKTYISFNIEIQFLRTFFLNNGYPEKIFDYQLRLFLNKTFIKRPPISKAEKEILYIKLPYQGEQICREINKGIRTIMNKNFPQINIRTIFYNNFKMKNFFHHKDRIPANWCSDIVYMFKCAVCDNCYLGSSNRSLAVRASEHAGISYRTKRHLVQPPQSSVREHSENNCKKQVDISEFSVIFKGNHLNEIRIAESLLIKNLKPSLNQETSSFPLKLF